MSKTATANGKPAESGEVAARRSRRKSRAALAVQAAGLAGTMAAVWLIAAIDPGADWEPGLIYNNAGARRSRQRPGARPPEDESPTKYAELHIILIPAPAGDQPPTERGSRLLRRLRLLRGPGRAPAGAR